MHKPRNRSQGNQERRPLYRPRRSQLERSSGHDGIPDPRPGRHRPCSLGEDGVDETDRQSERWRGGKEGKHLSRVLSMWFNIDKTPILLDQTYVIPRGNGEVVLGGTRDVGVW